MTNANPPPGQRPPEQDRHRATSDAEAAERLKQEKIKSIEARFKAFEAARRAGVNVGEPRLTPEEMQILGIDVPNQAGARRQATSAPGEDEDHEGGQTTQAQAASDSGKRVKAWTLEGVGTKGYIGGQLLPLFRKGWTVKQTNPATGQSETVLICDAEAPADNPHALGAHVQLVREIKDALWEEIERDNPNRSVVNAGEGQADNRFSERKVDINKVCQVGVDILTDVQVDISGFRQHLVGYDPRRDQASGERIFGDRATFERHRHTPIAGLLHDQGVRKRFIAEDNDKVSVIDGLNLALRLKELKVAGWEDLYDRCGSSIEGFLRSNYSTYKGRGVSRDMFTYENFAWYSRALVVNAHIRKMDNGEAYQRYKMPFYGAYVDDPELKAWKDAHGLTKDTLLANDEVGEFGHGLSLLLKGWQLPLSYKTAAGPMPLFQMDLYRSMCNAMMPWFRDHKSPAPTHLPEYSKGGETEFQRYGAGVLNRLLGGDYKEDSFGVALPGMDEQRDKTVCAFKPNGVSGMRESVQQYIKHNRSKVMGTIPGYSLEVNEKVDGCMVAGANLAPGTNSSDQISVWDVQGISDFDGLGHDIISSVRARVRRDVRHTTDLNASDVTDQVLDDIGVDNWARRKTVERRVLRLGKRLEGVNRTVPAGGADRSDYLANEPELLEAGWKCIEDGHLHSLGLDMTNEASIRGVIAAGAAARGTTPDRLLAAFRRRVPLNKLRGQGPVDPSEQMLAKYIVHRKIIEDEASRRGVSYDELVGDSTNPGISYGAKQAGLNEEDLARKIIRDKAMREGRITCAVAPGGGAVADIKRPASGDACAEVELASDTEVQRAVNSVGAGGWKKIMRGELIPRLAHEKLFWAIDRYVYTTAHTLFEKSGLNESQDNELRMRNTMWKVGPQGILERFGPPSMGWIYDNVLFEQSRTTDAELYYEDGHGNPALAEAMRNLSYAEKDGLEAKASKTMSSTQGGRCLSPDLADPFAMEGRAKSLEDLRRSHFDPDRDKYTVQLMADKAGCSNLEMEEFLAGMKSSTEAYVTRMNAMIGKAINLSSNSDSRLGFDKNDVLQGFRGFSHPFSRLDEERAEGIYLATANFFGEIGGELDTVIRNLANPYLPTGDEIRTGAKTAHLREDAITKIQGLIFRGTSTHNREAFLRIGQRMLKKPPSDAVERDKAERKACLDVYTTLVSAYSIFIGDAEVVQYAKEYGEPRDREERKKMAPDFTNSEAMTAHMTETDGAGRLKFRLHRTTNAECEAAIRAPRRPDETIGRSKYVPLTGFVSGGTGNDVNAHLILDMNHNTRIYNQNLDQVQEDYERGMVPRERIREEVMRRTAVDMGVDTSNWVRGANGQVEMAKQFETYIHHLRDGVLEQRRGLHASAITHFEEAYAVASRSGFIIGDMNHNRVGNGHHENIRTVALKMAGWCAAESSEEKLQVDKKGARKDANLAVQYGTRAWKISRGQRLEEEEQKSLRTWEKITRWFKQRFRDSHTATTNVDAAGNVVGEDAEACSLLAKGNALMERTQTFTGDTSRKWFLRAGVAGAATTAVAAVTTIATGGAALPFWMMAGGAAAAAGGIGGVRAFERQRVAERWANRAYANMGDYLLPPGDDPAAVAARDAVDLTDHTNFRELMQQRKIARGVAYAWNTRADKLWVHFLEDNAATWGLNADAHQRRINAARVLEPLSATDILGGCLIDRQIGEPIRMQMLADDTFDVRNEKQASWRKAGHDYLGSWGHANRTEAEVLAAMGPGEQNLVHMCNSARLTSRLNKRSLWNRTVSTVTGAPLFRIMDALHINFTGIRGGVLGNDNLRMTTTNEFEEELSNNPDASVNCSASFNHQAATHLIEHGQGEDNLDEYLPLASGLLDNARNKWRYQHSLNQQLSKLLCLGDLLVNGAGWRKAINDDEIRRFAEGGERHKIKYQYR